MAEPPVEEVKGIHKRGRPRVRRASVGSGPFSCYAPQCDIQSENGKVTLLPEELEILQLIDLDGLEQESAAKILGISRRTLWKDLHEARRKVADALVNGKMIEISGCSRRYQSGCPKSDGVICPDGSEVMCPRRNGWCDPSLPK